MRLRASSTDNTASTYYDADGTAGGTSMIVGKSNVNGSVGWVDVFFPADAVATGFIGQSANAIKSAPVAASHGGSHTTASAFDGFTITPSTSTLTGDIRVYALANA